MKAVSRQLKWQRDRLALGMCPYCRGKLALGFSRCAKCLKKARERARKVNGCTRRWTGAASYVAERARRKAKKEAGR